MNSFSFLRTALVEPFLDLRRGGRNVQYCIGRDHPSPETREVSYRHNPVHCFGPVDKKSAHELSIATYVDRAQRGKDSPRSPTDQEVGDGDVHLPSWCGVTCAQDYDWREFGDGDVQTLLVADPESGPVTVVGTMSADDENVINIALDLGA